MKKKPIFPSLAITTVQIPALEIYRRHVEKSGTGAHIVFLKEHLGKEVVVIVREK